MSSILGEFQSAEALRELAVSKGYGEDGQSEDALHKGQFRRAAWLFLLGLPLNSSTSQDPQPFHPESLSLLQQSQNLDSQLDHDGWQLTKDFNPNQIGDSWIQTQEDEWQTATSKRSKRIKRNQNHSESGNGNGHHDDDDHDEDGDEGDRDGDDDTDAEGRESNTTSSNSQVNSSIHSSNSPSQIKNKSLLASNRFNLQEDGVSNEMGKSSKRKKKSKKKSKGNKNNVSNDQANGTHDSESKKNGSEKNGDHHKDETQVELDIRRSFVSFQDGALKDPTLRERRRDQLREMVVGVLRKHPAFSYFQGYHDILSIILLTLNSEEPPSIISERSESPWISSEDRDLTLKACERISLHFVRDSMTENMDPVMGQLKVVRNILRLVDRDLATQVEQASPLPFFALPWLLTLFSHDLPFETTQMIFDFIISHGPSSVLYLCVSIILTKKETLDSEPDLCSDPAFLHQYLSQLPDFRLFQSATSSTTSNPNSDPNLSRKERGPDSDSTEAQADQSVADLMTESEYLQNGINEEGKGFDDDEDDEEENSWERKRQPIKVQLSEILEKSKELMKAHPLELVADPMGKKSVLWTWQEIFSDKGNQNQGNNSAAGNETQDAEQSQESGNRDGKEIKKNGKSKTEGGKKVVHRYSDRNQSNSTDPTGSTPISHEKFNSINRSPASNVESEDWKFNDSLAEEVVIGEISQIVKDPKPSPPTSVAGDESPFDEYSKEFKRGGRDDDGGERRKKKKEKRIGDNILTIAAVGVTIAGVLVAVHSASNQSPNAAWTRNAIGLAGAFLGLGKDW